MGLLRKAVICSALVRVVFTGVAPCAIWEVLPVPASVPFVPLPKAPEGAPSPFVMGFPLLRLLSTERGVSCAIDWMHGRVMGIGSAAMSDRRISQSVNSS